MHMRDAKRCTSQNHQSCLLKFLCLEEPSWAPFIKLYHTHKSNCIHRAAKTRPERTAKWTILCWIFWKIFIFHFACYTYSILFGEWVKCTYWSVKKSKNSFDLSWNCVRRRGTSKRPPLRILLKCVLIAFVLCMVLCCTVCAQWCRKNILFSLWVTTNLMQNCWIGKMQDGNGALNELRGAARVISFGSSAIGKAMIW